MKHLKNVYFTLVEDFHQSEYYCQYISRAKKMKIKSQSSLQKQGNILMEGKESLCLSARCAIAFCMRRVVINIFLVVKRTTTFKWKGKNCERDEDRRRRMFTHSLKQSLTEHTKEHFPKRVATPRCYPPSLGVSSNTTF